MEFSIDIQARRGTPEFEALFANLQSRTPIVVTVAGQQLRIPGT